MDEKAIEILRVIIENGPVKRPEIAARLSFKIHVDTISEIIARWNTLFQSIGDKSMRITYTHNIGYELNHDYFSPGRARFLRDAVRAATVLSEKEKRILSELLFPFTKEMTESAEEDSFLVRLEIIDRAIQNRKTLRFSYVHYVVENPEHPALVVKYRTNGNDHTDKSGLTYLISPYELFMYKGQYYLLGYCDKRADQLSVFRVDRMRDIRPSRPYYKDQYLALAKDENTRLKMVNMYIGTEILPEITIRFEDTALAAIIDQFGTDLDLESCPDAKDHYLMTIHDYAVTDGLLGWLLMMGDQVQIIRPLELKDQFLARLAAIQALYDSEDEAV